MKTCTKCGEQKPLSEFYKSSKAYDGFQSSCKSCHNTICKNYNKNNKQKRASYNKKYGIEKNYGISFTDYEKILKSQNSKCAICKKDLEPGKLTHLDHCHTTNVIRGVLCSKCNTGLGLFNDSIQSLTNAIEYISHYEILSGEKS